MRLSDKIHLISEYPRSRTKPRCTADGMRQRESAPVVECSLHPKKSLPKKVSVFKDEFIRIIALRPTTTVDHELKQLSTDG